MAADPRQTLGRRGEALAAEHLERRGCTILTRNYRTRWGELDIVALDGQTLVFCEVKTRQSRGGRPRPLEAIRGEKQLRVRRMAATWLAQTRSRPYAPEIRFDAIGVLLDGSGALAALEHLEAAF
jgi:putative endonuclease